MNVAAGAIMPGDEHALHDVLACIMQDEHLHIVLKGNTQPQPKSHAKKTHRAPGQSMRSNNASQRCNHPTPATNCSGKQPNSASRRCDASHAAQSTCNTMNTASMLRRSTAAYHVADPFASQYSACRRVPTGSFPAFGAVPAAQPPACPSDVFATKWLGWQHACPRGATAMVCSKLTSCRPVRWPEAGSSTARSQTSPLRAGGGSTATRPRLLSAATTCTRS